MFGITVRDLFGCDESYIITSWIDSSFEEDDRSFRSTDEGDLDLAAPHKTRSRTLHRYYSCGDGEYRSLSELGSISFVGGRAVAIIETHGRERIQEIDMDDVIDIVEEGID